MPHQHADSSRLTACENPVFAFLAPAIGYQPSALHPATGALCHSGHSLSVAEGGNTGERLEVKGNSDAV